MADARMGAPRNSAGRFAAQSAPTDGCVSVGLWWAVAPPLPRLMNSTRGAYVHESTRTSRAAGGASRAPASSRARASASAATWAQALMAPSVPSRRVAGERAPPP